MLGQCLQEKGIHVEHATGDADLLIVKTAVDYTQTNDTAVVGEDTDLLRLMCYYYNIRKHNLFFFSGTNKYSRKTVKNWDINRTKIVLGDGLCTMLPFLHAITGCDTTSRMFGVGKGVALKKLISDDHLKDQAVLFNSNATKSDKINQEKKRSVVYIMGLPSRD